MSGGCNSIVDNRTPKIGTPPYDTQFLMNSPGMGLFTYVFADYNYWGNNPLYRLSERFGNLIVIYDPPLDEPCYQANLAKSLVMTLSNGDVLDTIYAIDKSFDPLNETQLLYASASENFYTADYASAEILYNQIINGNDSLSTKLKACQRLYEIGNLDSKPPSYFEELYNKFISFSESTKDSLLKKVFVQLRTLCLIGKDEFIPAIGEFDQIIQNNPSSEEAVYAEIDALTTSLLLQEDSTLHKSKYFTTSEDYSSMIKNILQKNFGTNQKSETLSIIPTTYQLYQNYPNPFNPSTTIKYDIPKASNVTLKVYDILGREVITLVNNKTKQPGAYEVKFDASWLASGIYIYRLVTDKYVTAKKMMLLK